MAYKKAFVTGGTGFVGFYVVKALVARGLQVRALIRPSSSPSSVQRLKTLGIELAIGDLLEPDSYAPALDNISYVFHCAGLHKIGIRDTKLLYRTNVEATRRLLEASSRRGVEQFVYTSSIKTIGLSSSGVLSDEDMAYNLWDCDTEYGKTKYLAEKFLLEADVKIPIKMLNPSVVIGPGDESLTPMMRIISDFLQRKIKVSINTSTGFVDAQDVGLAHVLALEKAKPKQRYILNAVNWTMDELFALLSQYTHIPVPRFKIPYCLAYPVACASLAMSAVTKRAPAVIPRSLNIARKMPSYNGEKAARELGIQYRDVRLSLKETVEWLQHHQER
ncbi:MAG: NAD-dependent epimerase/dehydratase family protein [Candidatus Omnitrophota bacterium]